jgi:hypothetical protein
MERLLREPQQQRLIDLLMNEFYAIFEMAKTELKTCAGSQGSSSQDPGQATVSKNSQSSSNAIGTKHRTDDTRGILEKKKRRRKTTCPSVIGLYLSAQATSSLA